MGWNICKSHLFPWMMSIITWYIMTPHIDIIGVALFKSLGGFRYVMWVEFVPNKRLWYACNVMYVMSYLIGYTFAHVMWWFKENDFFQNDFQLLNFTLDHGFIICLIYHNGVLYLGSNFIWLVIIYCFVYALGYTHKTVFWITWISSTLYHN